MTTEQQTPVAPATEAKPNGQTQATTPTAATPAETPAEIMIPKHRYDEVSNKLKALEDDAAKAAKAREEEDNKKLAAQAEWQKLAESHKTKLDALEPAHAAAMERKDKLEAMLSEQLESEIAEWPAEVKALDPGKDADLLVRLDFVNKSRALAAKLGAQPPVGGNGRGPRPTGPAGRQNKKIEPIYDVRKGF